MAAGKLWYFLDNGTLVCRVGFGSEFVEYWAKQTKTWERLKGQRVEHWLTGQNYDAVGISAEEAIALTTGSADTTS